MHNGNWKDILSNRLFFISPGDDFTIRCAEEAFKENGSVDCFYIAFDSPDKKPGGIHDYIIILQEFRADFIDNHWVQYAPGFFCFIPPGITHEVLLSQAPDIDNYSIKFRYVPNPRISDNGTIKSPEQQ